MAYLGSWKIDDLLTFPANTHTASTGAATDADAVPAYRVYEDETGTAILTGSMAKLDDTNTTGFYSEQLTLSAANGFEKGKCYTIYISAAVASVTGTMAHTFQLEAEVDSNTNSGTVTPAAGSITAAVIATDAIDADALADGAITAATFAAGAIDATAIATNAIDDDAIATGAIASTAFASGAVTAAALATDAVNEIRDGILDAAMAAELASLPSQTTPTVRQMLQYLFQRWRNRYTITATSAVNYKSDGTTALQTSAVSDDGTTVVRGAGS